MSRIWQATSYKNIEPLTIEILNLEEKSIHLSIKF